MRKKITQAPANLTLEELKKAFIDTIWPYEKLKIDIVELEKIDLPSAKIASFLFKAQLVELELRSLLESIDSFIVFKSKGFPIYRKKIQYRELTLGKLKNELKEYEYKSLDKLLTKVESFKKKRDIFTHNLYVQGKDIKKLAIEADKYKNYAEESLVFIESIRGEIWKTVS